MHYLGFSLICSISWRISSIIFLHYCEKIISNRFDAYVDATLLMIKKKEVLENPLQCYIFVFVNNNLIIGASTVTIKKS
jgi:hypothetical protein